ncbi:HAD-IA family hydrolase [Paenibacillus chungangensis]|uniref:HAD-IA family hydrolase n=1 Tax=Paenibacillus chungangensis TaxID=696535 RepID=A0ABW3HPV7_9BACL
MEEAITVKHPRLQLVLDVGGVLASNLSPVFWELVSEAAGIPSGQNEIYKLYRKEVSEKLWIGEITEQQFWEWLEAQSPSLVKELCESFLYRCLQPLPAMGKLETWSRSADIHILSNHIEIWLQPLLNRIRPSIGHTVISSQVAMKKPDAAIFHHMAALLPSGSPILFVDDKPGNLEIARSVGWQSMLADPEGVWLSLMDKRLASGGQA